MICRAERNTDREKVTTQRPGQDRRRNDRDNDFLIFYNEHEAEAKKTDEKGEAR